MRDRATLGAWSPGLPPPGTPPGLPAGRWRLLMSVQLEGDASKGRAPTAPLCSFQTVGRRPSVPQARPPKVTQDHSASGKNSDEVHGSTATRGLWPAPMADCGELSALLACLEPTPKCVA